MSSPLKRQNHRIHPCAAARKNALLAHLIAHYADKAILVVTSGSASGIEIESYPNVTLAADADLTPEQTCDVLISYDLPDKALIYMTRIARAGEYALILLGSDDQRFLYPIETLLGRTILQEPISGFEPDFGIAVEQKSKEEAKARRAERDAKFPKKESGDKRDFKPRGDKPRYEGKREERGGREGEKPFTKPRSDRPDDKRQGGYGKDSKPRFVGKDENGKPIFEGKTRERNHYHDGTPRSDAEKAARTPYSNKPKFFGGEKKESEPSRPVEGGKKPYEKKPYEGKKPFDKEKKPFEGKKPSGDKKPYEKKPYDKDGKKPFGEKKEFGDKKPFGEKKPYGEKKPFGDKKPYGEKKPYDKKPGFDSSKPSAEPKRPPRRINVKSFKPKES